MDQRDETFRCHPVAQGRRPARSGALLALWLALAPGCADQEHPRLAEYLGGVVLDVPLQSKVSVDMGEFDVPVTLHSTSDKRAGKPVRMRLKFSLSAEAKPAAEAAVLDAYDRHRGAVNDAILTIIRHSSADDLADPRLAAIKARMIEKVRPLLGSDGIRQLVLNDIATESL
jgi:hypothetical protein